MKRTVAGHLTTKSCSCQNSIIMATMQPERSLSSLPSMLRSNQNHAFLTSNLRRTIRDMINGIGVMSMVNAPQDTSSVRTEEARFLPLCATRGNLNNSNSTRNIAWIFSTNTPRMLTVNHHGCHTDIMSSGSLKTVTTISPYLVNIGTTYRSFSATPSSSPSPGAAIAVDDDIDVLSDDYQKTANNTTANTRARKEAGRLSAVPTGAFADVDPLHQPLYGHQRVWLANGGRNNCTTYDTLNMPVEPRYWTRRVADGADDTGTFAELLDKIEQQEIKSGGRLRARQLGVLHEDPSTDMELLTQNYTVSSLASALRDREDVLQHAAVLSSEGRHGELDQLLQVFHPKYVQERRARKQSLNITKRLDSHGLEVIRKALMRMPRTVSQSYSRRAGVVIPLCLVDDVPCLLLEKRSSDIPKHPDEVCLPGGMVCHINDTTIVATCLREMQEEIGGLQASQIQVLGVFRCNWGEVHHLVGVAVTPVVCFLGELPELLQPCNREVSEIFTIPLASLLDKAMWVHKDGMAPIFLGAPHVIWGLTGYILDRFYRDILLPNTRQKATEDEQL